MGRRHKLYAMLLRKKDGSIKGFIRRVDNNFPGDITLVQTFSATRVSVFARPPYGANGWNGMLKAFNKLPIVNKGDEIFISRLNSKECPIKIMDGIVGNEEGYLPCFKFIQTDGRNPPTAI